MPKTSTTISVKASGVSDNGFPTFTLIVDGMPMAQQSVTSTATTYDFAATLDLAAAHDIQVAFYNTNGQRTLELSSITVAGVTILATDPRETYTSRVGTVTGSGDLRYGGVAEFRLPAGSLTSAATIPSATTTPIMAPLAATPAGTPASSTSSASTSPTSNTIAVSAHGIPDSNGGFPALTLIVDGSSIGAQQTVTGTDAIYSFAYVLSASTAHTVQVGFYNTNGTRALELNSITVNGTTYLATDPSETYSSRVGTVQGSGDMRYGGVATFSIPAATSRTPQAQTTSPQTAPVQTAPVSTSAAAFYVSTTGSDAADGSLAHPFRSLEHAVAAMKQGSVHATYVEGGSYVLGSKISLSQAQSGFTIAGYNGQKPMFGSSNLSTMIELNGAANVTIDGLGFKPGGNTAITLTGANGNVITGNFVQGGGSAIVLTGSSNNVLSGNEVDQSGLAGIELKDGSNANVVDSNVINGTTSGYTQGGGIYAHGVTNTRITHNIVENTAGTGIAFENFDSNITINVGNTVSYNKILNTGTTTAYDTGSIYVLGRANVDTKMLIDHNYIDKSGAGGDAHTIAIYLDDNTDGATVTNNIARNVGTHALELHNGHNNTISNNIFDLDATTNSVAFIQTVPEGPINNMYGNTITRNIIESHKIFQTGYEAFDGGIASVVNNLYYSAVGGSFAMSGSASDTRPVFGDPRFIDEPAGNYALGSGSAAAQIGFFPIDQSTIGLQAQTHTWFS